jgi:integrase
MEEAAMADDDPTKKTRERKRHRNNGLRKGCDCPRRAWAKCRHPWHFNFKPRGGKDYRLSLDRYLGRHVDSKSEAEAEAEKIRTAIREGRFGTAAPVLDQLTMKQLLDSYVKRYVDVERGPRGRDARYSVGTITRVEIERADGRCAPFGEWLVRDVTTDTIERFREARRHGGIVAANRDLAFLRAAFNWAIRTKHVKETPFKLGTETVVRLSREHARTRRLDEDEGQKLLDACAPRLRALVEAALETGCRRGELLSMQWKQILGMTINDDKTIAWAAKSEIFLPHSKTKTKRDRRIPISTRLKAILEMRRFDPAGHPLEETAFVFGTEIGTRLMGFGRAWRTAILRSHGHEPTYSDTANLSPESRAELRRINLHFHDLRREAGSRWMDGGVPIATIQRWLGHTNVSQTSTYLAGTASSEHDAMERFEQRRSGLQPLATHAETRDQTTVRAATSVDSKSNRDAVDHDAAIM